MPNPKQPGGGYFASVQDNFDEAGTADEIKAMKERVNTPGWRYRPEAVQPTPIPSLKPRPQGFSNVPDVVPPNVAAAGRGGLLGAMLPQSRGFPRSQEDNSLGQYLGGITDSMSPQESLARMNQNSAAAAAGQRQPGPAPAVSAAPRLGPGLPGGRAGYFGDATINENELRLWNRGGGNAVGLNRYVDNIPQAGGAVPQPGGGAVDPYDRLISEMRRNMQPQAGGAPAPAAPMSAQPGLPDYRQDPAGYVIGLGLSRGQAQQPDTTVRGEANSSLHDRNMQAIAGIGGAPSPTNLIGGDLARASQIRADSTLAYGGLDNFSQKWRRVAAHDAARGPVYRSPAAEVAAMRAAGIDPATADPIRQPLPPQSAPSGPVDFTDFIDRARNGDFNSQLPQRPQPQPGIDDIIRQATNRGPASGATAGTPVPGGLNTDATYRDRLTEYTGADPQTLAMYSPGQQNWRNTPEGRQTHIQDMQNRITKPAPFGPNMNIPQQADAYNQNVASGINQQQKMIDRVMAGRKYREEAGQHFFRKQNPGLFSDNPAARLMSMLAAGQQSGIPANAITGMMAEGNKQRSLQQEFDLAVRAQKHKESESTAKLQAEENARIASLVAAQQERNPDLDVAAATEMWRPIVRGTMGGGTGAPGVPGAGGGPPGIASRVPKKVLTHESAEFGDALDRLSVFSGGIDSLPPEALQQQLMQMGVTPEHLQRFVETNGDRPTFGDSWFSSTATPARLRRLGLAQKLLRAYGIQPEVQPQSAFSGDSYPPVPWQ